MAQLDMDAVVNDMMAVLKQTVTKHWKELKIVMEQFLINRKERFKLLAELRMTGELSPENFDSRLQDEKRIAEAEMNALEVISKAMTQKAANAVIEVFEQAVKKALL